MQSPKITPLMQQYADVKAQHPDKIILFRMGDFFEMFHKDAEVAAPVIGIALTQRNKKDADSAKMCGVPHHSIATPIAKLLHAGHKVAICDQIEDPATAKGLVKRAVTRVLTPGMVYDPDTLDQLSAHYLAAYDDSHVAFADITTGEAFYFQITSVQVREELLLLLSPAELIISADQAEARRRIDHKKVILAPVTLISVSDSKRDDPIACIGRIKAYIVGLQGEEVVQGLAPFERRSSRSHLRLSAKTIRHLEMFENARGEKQGSLFHAINRTQTSAGARLLKSWLQTPLTDLEEIEKRQNEVQWWTEHLNELKRLRQVLGQIGDLERRLGKLSTTTFNGRDLSAIAQSLAAGESLASLHPEGSAAMTEFATTMTLARKIAGTLHDELPLSVKEGGLIRTGISPELDELILLTQDSQQLLLQLEEREKQSTGISSLKVRYNSVFGFYIELTKLHSHKAPSHYQRKQTLTNAERYTTDELHKLEEKVLSARSRRDLLEYEIFTQLKNEVAGKIQDLIHLARLWARWDVLSSLAWLAVERRYQRPRFSAEGQLHLELCRHPVVEYNKNFVANTISMLPGESLLLTGPNMAGKSTLMRQVALIAILAQAGSFVPAEKAILPLFEQLFTRIGANDFLSEGLSTFMVEMSETADILNTVTARSLVIMDEIGRGTSTFDGLSLAQSILEHLVGGPKPYLFFATHYHELTRLSSLFPQIHNAHMSVQEKSGEIRFLYTLKAGPANRSYGIHVAKIAGLPATVTARAQKLLAGFEGDTGTQLALFQHDIST